MIGPGGLVLVVPHLFAVPISVLWVGLQKSKYLNLDVKNIFAGSHRLSTPGDALLRIERPITKHRLVTKHSPGVAACLC
jgi:hypothetical protein